MTEPSNTTQPGQRSERKARSSATITLELQPEGRISTIERPKTVRQLLDRLDLLEETALVIRNGTLLTPDLAIQPNDSIIVREVTSRG